MIVHRFDELVYPARHRVGFLFVFINIIVKCLLLHKEQNVEVSDTTKVS